MVSKELSHLEEKLSLYEAVLNNILSGVLITDTEGYVIFFSDTYGLEKRDVAPYIYESKADAGRALLEKK